MSLMNYITDLLFEASDEFEVPAEYSFVEDEQPFYVGDVVRYTPHRNLAVSYIGTVVEVDVLACEVKLEYYAPASAVSPKATVITGWRSFDECELVGIGEW
jgi:hypothetical protein